MTLADFDGETYEHDRDYGRLGTMLNRVHWVVADGCWHTLAELAALTGGTEAAISARLRDLRKPKFGAHTIERRHVGAGLWEYRYRPNLGGKHDERA
jgi:hypothetical protein